MHGSASTLIIEPAREPLMRGWHLGTLVEDRFRPWAGGVSEAALSALLRAEQRRVPGLRVDDRRG